MGLPAMGGLVSLADDWMMLDAARPCPAVAVSEDAAGIRSVPATATKRP